MYICMHWVQPNPSGDPTAAAPTTQPPAADDGDAKDGHRQRAA